MRTGPEDTLSPEATCPLPGFCPAVGLSFRHRRGLLWGRAECSGPASCTPGGLHSHRAAVTRVTSPLSCLLSSAREEGVLRHRDTQGDPWHQEHKIRVQRAEQARASVSPEDSANASAAGASSCFVSLAVAFLRKQILPVQAAGTAAGDATAVTGTRSLCREGGPGEEQGNAGWPW